MKNCSFCKSIETYKFIEDTDGQSQQPVIIKIKNDSIDGYILLMADRDYLVINYCPICGRGLKKLLK